MSEIEKTIEVQVPSRTAYDQWTQFESFPEFMEGVREIRQLDDTTVHWTAEIGGQVEEWDARITEQVPDQRIAWRSITGAANAGDVRFEALGADRTRVVLHLVYEPEGIKEHVGDALGIVSRRVEGDLERFKTFIEERGVATGAHRDEHHNAAPGGANNPEA